MDCDVTQELELSIIIPALNEAAVIASTLSGLKMLKSDEVEIIVVDGGSIDRTVEIANQRSARVLVEPGGRAIQMNYGAKHACGRYLLFLHADTQMPSNSLEILTQYFRQNCIWGRFDLRLSGQNRFFRVLEYCINFRSRLSGIASGDQSIFVKHTVFRKLGGYPEIPLMEDIALSKKLKKISKPVCLRQKVITSSRRWEQRGILRTVVLMLTLRLLYFLGSDPRLFSRWYR